MPLREGENVGPYRIIAQLGQGGMATVYKAYHPQLDRYVAIKMMHSAFLEDPTFHARFQREAQIVARLEHPHIIPVYDFNQHENQPYLVMKFVEGKTLKGSLVDGALTLNQVLHVVTSVSSALTYAHEKGVLHRDIKPSNIIIDDDNVPYLSDFGLARIAEAGESTMSGDMILGTPQYISPEQARGEKNLDGRTDIYSLGVVLYELVVGRVPFSADTPYAIIHDHIYSPLPLPSHVNPDIPPRVETVLLKALAKDPADRYDSAVQMANAFKQAVNDAGLSELRPDRVSTSAVSLGKMREQLNQQILSGSKPAPVTGIPTPVVTSSAPLSQSALRRKQQREQRWMWGGCLAFLLVCALSGFISMSVIGQFGEIGATLDAQGIGATVRSFDEDVPPPGEIVIFEGDAPPPTDHVPRYGVPELSLEEAQRAVDEQPENPISYLALARAQIEANMLQEARRTISDGMEVTDDQLRYLMTAGDIISEAGYHEGAIVPYMVALNLAQNSGNDELYASVRAEVGQYLYSLAENTQGFDLPAVAVTVSRAPELQQMDTSFLDIFVARSLIYQGRPILAAQRLNRLVESENAFAETYLVLGEFYLEQGEPEDAIDAWNRVLDDNSAPQWVRERAEEFIANAEG